MRLGSIPRNIQKQLMAPIFLSVEKTLETYCEAPDINGRIVDGEGDRSTHSSLCMSKNNNQMFGGCSSNNLDSNLLNIHNEWVCKRKVARQRISNSLNFFTTEETTAARK